MTIAITDANIFIDLFELELLSFLFELDLAIHTTEEVLLECDSNQQAQLKLFMQHKLLAIHILTDSQVANMQTLDFSKRLSYSDQTILSLAYQEKSMVLTGDMLIRKWCVRHHLEVHGILWILEEFVNKGLIGHKAAIEKLRYLMQINMWLPMKVCETLIKAWEAKLK